MVGRLLSFWGPAYFQGRTVSFRDGIVFLVEINFFGLIQLMKSQHQFPTSPMDHDVHAGILGPLAVAKTLWQVLAASADGSAEDDFLRVFFGFKDGEATQKDLENTLKLFTKKLSLGIPFIHCFVGSSQDISG